VIAALEGAPIAGAFPADQRAAVRAGIVERIERAVAVARQDQRAAADPAGDEAARRGNL
jgi:hypothetical protein